MTTKGYSTNETLELILLTNAVAYRGLVFYGFLFAPKKLLFAEAEKEVVGGQKIREKN